jgi:hypothetical protein
MYGKFFSKTKVNVNQLLRLCDRVIAATKNSITSEHKARIAYEPIFVSILD